MSDDICPACQTAPAVADHGYCEECLRRWEREEADQEWRQAVADLDADWRHGPIDWSDRRVLCDD